MIKYSESGAFMFELTDKKGESHRYYVDPHPPARALDLSVRLAKATIEPVVGLLVEGLMAYLDSKGSTKALELPDLASMLGKSLDAFDPATIRALFAHVRRDDKELSVEALFNAAYRANYGEMYSALFIVIKENGFVPLDELSRKVTELLNAPNLEEKLASMLPVDLMTKLASMSEDE